MAKTDKKDKKGKKAAAPAAPPAELMDLVENFLSEHAPSAHVAFKKQHGKKSSKSKDATKKHRHNLVSVFQTWETSLSTPEGEPVTITETVVQNVSSSSSSSSSDSSSEEDVDMADAAAAESSSDSSSDSDSSSSDSDSDSDDEPAPKIAVPVVNLKRKAPASDSSDSSDSDSSDSDSESDKKRPTAKKLEDGQGWPALRSRHKKEKTKAKKAAVEDAPSDSSVTLDNKTSPDFQAPPLPPDPSTLNNRGRGNMNNQKGKNVPFSRIKESTYVDPRFASNDYVPNDYSDRAHADLIVTKGKGFTKEKNKKKKGSYRGGMIDIGGRGGVKFDE
ncbi:predicted protein [Verticillium alfalfae VaMs.102]|uniref:Predicted protein n=1 Tax=Verticillium alfalfae (strain VaMs.102 / ATCC MYA-4576 / FGSC 10136) TaxID=526221 RepID=C9SSP1_VERA1|nr:predicted protein [Verticillium alfalfae VaMs.102]EEY21806.1 predicted protein [Verticillium alfalfae VaMs.102]